MIWHHDLGADLPAEVFALVVLLHRVIGVIRLQIAPAQSDNLGMQDGTAATAATVCHASILTERYVRKAKPLCLPESP